jgi:catechol 2,3-dioxygenase-like lactoylglutathione lyase family enzyme
MMRHSVAVFSVRNIAESLTYYRDKLGFNIAFEYGRPVVYAGLCEGNVSLHLREAAAYGSEPGHGTTNTASVISTWRTWTAT